MQITRKHRDCFLFDTSGLFSHQTACWGGGGEIPEQATIHHVVNEPTELSSSTKTHLVQLGKAKASFLEEGIFVLSR